MTARLVGLLFSGFAVRAAAGIGAILIGSAVWSKLAPLYAALTIAAGNP